MTYDDVIQEIDSDNLPRKVQFFRGLDISSAGSGVAAGVVVGANDARRAGQNCGFEDFSGMDDCRGCATTAHQDPAERHVFPIQQNRVKPFDSGIFVKCTF